MTGAIVRFLSALLIAGGVAVAQIPGPNLCGVVTDKNNKPLPGASVILRDVASETGAITGVPGIVGTLSDAHGHFCIATFVTQKGTRLGPAYTIAAAYKGVETTQVGVAPPKGGKWRPVHLQVPVVAPKSGK